MAADEPIEYEDGEEGIVIERRVTGIRIAYTLLFFVIAQVVETALTVIVLFELIYSLVTERPPSGVVRGFANRVLAYFYRIGRYVTYNDPEPPFPFREFPEEVEAVGELSGGSMELEQQDSEWRSS